MTKKEYLKPVIEVVEIESCQMISSSDSSTQTVSFELDEESDTPVNNIFGDAKGRGDAGSSYGDLW